MKKYLYALLALTLTASANAQTHDADDERVKMKLGSLQTGSPSTMPYYRYELHTVKKFSLLLGYNFGKYDYGEVGLSLESLRRWRSKTRHTMFFVSTELKTRQTFIMAPKAGVWVGNGLGVGLSALYYMQTGGANAAAMRIRPEVGVVSDGFKLMYGYNIPVDNKSFPGVSKHVVSLAINTRLAKVSETKKERDWNPKGRVREEQKSKDTSYSKDYGVFLVGLHGLTDMFGEVGIAFYSDESKGKKKSSGMNGMGFLAAEFKLTDQTIIAPKIGMYLHGAKKVSAGVGTSLIYYVGMGQSSLAVRPELGLNIGMLRLTAGYNHILTNYAYPSVGTFNFSGVMGLKLGKGKENRRVKNKGTF